MTKHPHQLSEFETRLLEELKRVAADGSIVDTSPVADTAVAVRPPNRRRRMAYGLAVTAVAATTLGIVGPLTFGGKTAQAAPFTVVPQSDGTVRFAILAFRDPEGLEQRLNSLGVKAEVDYVPEGKKCADGRFTEFRVSNEAMHEIIHWVEPPRGRPMTDEELDYQRDGWTEVRPDLIPEGTTLVLTQTIWGDRNEGGSLGAYHLAQGPVGPCQLVPDPDNVDR